MSLLTRTQATSTRLLTAYGEAITCERVVEGAYNPTTGATTPGGDTTTNYSGVGLPTSYEAIEIDGTNIKTTDSLLLFYSTTEPAVGDTMTFNSLVYRALQVERISIQGGFALYKIQCRV